MLKIDFGSGYNPYKGYKTCDITYNFDNGTSPLIYKVVKGKTAKLPNNPICDGYIFGGWFTDKNGKGIRFTEDTIITSNITVYAYWVAVDDYGDILPEDIPSDKIIPSGLWIAGVSEQTYTGSYIKPSVRVYDNKKLLVLNKDYTIAYKNNINANDASDKQKAPQIIVTGKGNYTGKEIATFKIYPLLNEEEFNGTLTVKIPQ